MNMNEHPGFGVMIGMLGGNRETVEAHNAAMGKTIFKAEMIDNRFRLHFNDETGIIFYDDGQSCCECRYMHTDDNLESFANSIFIEAELAEARAKLKAERERLDWALECLNDSPRRSVTIRREEIDGVLEYRRNRDAAIDAARDRKSADSQSPPDITD
jgi:hypothetical protein